MKKLISSTFVLCMLLAAGCGTGTTDPGSGTPDSSAQAATPADQGQGATTAADPKDFAELLERYETKSAPYAKGLDDLASTWEGSPEKHMTEAALAKFFLGLPGFPEEGTEGRYAYFTKLQLTGGNWLLLTLEEAYGQSLIATVFTADGKATDGKRVFRQGEDASENRLTFLVAADGLISLFKESDTGDAIERDTLRFKVDAAGKFQSQ